MKKLYIVFSFFLAIFLIGIFFSIESINSSLLLDTSLNSKLEYISLTEFVILV